MQTTKSSPFSSFDQNYYAALRRISFEQAEAYKQQVVSGQKHTIDLGKSLGQINEVQALWIQNINPEQQKIEQEVYEQQQVRSWTIDLAAKYENWGVVPENMHTKQGKVIQEEIEQKQTIDLAKLIESPEELTEEMVEEVVGWSTAAEEATTSVIEDDLEDEVTTEDDVAAQVDAQAADEVDVKTDNLDEKVDAEPQEQAAEQAVAVVTWLEDTVVTQENPTNTPKNFAKKLK